MMIVLVLLGLLLLGGAAGLVLLSFTQRNRSLMLWAGVSAVLGLVVMFISISLVSVAPNERIVVLNKLSGNLQEPRGPGYVFVNPVTESYTTYDISRQTYTMSGVLYEGEIYGDDAVAARTRDSQEVTIDLTLIYSLDPENLMVIREDWPDERYRSEKVRPAIREVVRNVIGSYSAEEVTQKREEISNAIFEQIQQSMEVKKTKDGIDTPTGFLVHEVLLRNVTFSAEYRAAIEAAQIAEIRIRQEQYNVQVAQEEAKQIEARAEGAANARRIEAQAEADALELVAAVLRDNPELLEYTYVQNLSDQVTVLALPANSPFIFDLQSYLDNAPTPRPSDE